MVRFKTKKVHKKIDSGRTYNHIEGSGWNHYTKGPRKRTLTMERINNAYNFVFSFLERFTGTKASEKEISQKLDKAIESLKGAE